MPAKNARRALRAAEIDIHAKGLAQTGEPPRDSSWISLDETFKTKLTAALSSLESQGTPFRMVEGFRTVDRQQWLYGSGRPGTKPYGRPGSVVTNCDGVKKRSNHQGQGTPGTGTAADCYPLRDGKVWIPPSSNAIWDRYAEAVETQGLVAGHRWTKLVDSPHAELPAAGRVAATQFLNSLKVPVAAPKALKPFKALGQAPALPDSAPLADMALFFQDNTAQAFAAGSSLVMAEHGVPARVKQDVVNCLLAAQFAAIAAIKDPRDVMAWYATYFGALQKLGWVLTRQDFREFRPKGKSVEVHKAILSVLTIALGPAATTLAVVKAVFEGLEKVSDNSGWLTLFDRKSVTEKAASFQLTTMQPSQDGLVSLGLFAFELTATSKVTQVLFFKLKKGKAVLKFTGGNAAIDAALLASIRHDLNAKLTEAVRSFVASIQIPPQ